MVNCLFTDVEDPNYINVNVRLNVGQFDTTMASLYLKLIRDSVKGNHIFIVFMLFVKILLVTQQMKQDKSWMLAMDLWY